MKLNFDPVAFAQDLIKRGVWSTPESRRRVLPPITLYATASEPQVTRAKMRTLREARQAQGLRQDGSAHRTGAKSRWTGLSVKKLGHTRYAQLYRALQRQRKKANETKSQ